MAKVDPRSKKVYWLKLDKGFFKRHDVRIIEEMPNGKDYLLFYMKILLESLSHDGYLRFSETIPYDEKMLSVVTNTNIDIVRSAIKLFTSLHLMEILDDQTIYMTELQKMLGFETLDAERKRLEREAKKLLEVGQSPEMSHNISISDSISNNKDITKVLPKEDIVEVLDYLNNKLGTKYRASSQSTSKFLNARLKQYSVEDIKMVIDYKYNEWHGSDMEKYLRPETLFNETKFESYYNQAIQKHVKSEEIGKVTKI